MVDNGLRITTELSLRRTSNGRTRLANKEMRDQCAIATPEVRILSISAAKNIWLLLRILQNGAG